MLHDRDMTKPFDPTLGQIAKKGVQESTVITYIVIMSYVHVVENTFISVLS